MKSVSVIALGCPKNTVEAEYLLGVLDNKGYSIEADIEEADIIIIHTCSFIHDAALESEKYIRKAVAVKKKKNVKVYVSGCLSQLMKENLIKKFPLIDGYTGTGSLDKLPYIMENKAVGDFKPGGFNKSKYRILTSPVPSAYLKIAEGCNHRCSFCIIPDLRGKFVSRSINSLYEEAKSLADAGVSELILTAQDTSTYGYDIYKTFALDKLLSKLAKINGLKWIRLLYAYPSSITDSLLEVFAEYKNICKYIDIPIQHISKNMLAAMKRPLTTRRIIEKIKKKLPDIVLRTSIISGFPGEKESDVKELIDFINDGYFRYAGVFEYSDQKEAASSKLPGHIDASKTKERRLRIEKAQYKIFESEMEKLKGKEIEFFSEQSFKSKRKSGCINFGRASFQAPEIDGKTSVISKDPLQAGAFYKAVIKGNEGYNIKAEILSAVGTEK